MGTTARKDRDRPEVPVVLLLAALFGLTAGSIGCGSALPERTGDPKVDIGSVDGPTRMLALHRIRTDRVYESTPRVIALLRSDSLYLRQAALDVLGEFFDGTRVPSGLFEPLYRATPSELEQRVESWTEWYQSRGSDSSRSAFASEMPRWRWGPTPESETSPPDDATDSRTSGVSTDVIPGSTRLKTASGRTIVIPRVRSTVESVGDFGLFLRTAGYWFVPARFRERKGRIPFRETLIQIDRLGFGAVPLVAVVLFFVGMILALQLAGILGLLGVIEYVPDIVAVAMVREMAPLLTGVVLSGYAGAAIAAEIGSMKVSEELEALTALALPPERMLIAPRLLAAAITSPLLTIFACYVGIAGGMFVSNALLGLEPGLYLQRTIDALTLDSVILGFLKGVVFGGLVVSLACYQGSRVQGGAVGVGKATTRAVVHSVVGIIAADLLLTMLFFHVG